MYQRCLSLPNSPYVFCNFISTVLKGIEGIFLYLDDVLIYADNWEDNARIVNQVCEALNNAGLQINIDKTNCYKNLLNFRIYYFGRRY